LNDKDKNEKSPLFSILGDKKRNQQILASDEGNTMKMKQRVVIKDKVKTFGPSPRNSEREIVLGRMISYLLL